MATEEDRRIVEEAVGFASQRLDLWEPFKAALRDLVDERLDPNEDKHAPESIRWREATSHMAKAVVERYPQLAGKLAGFYRLSGDKALQEMGYDLEALRRQ